MNQNTFSMTQMSALTQAFQAQMREFLLRSPGLIPPILVPYYELSRKQRGVKNISEVQKENLLQYSLFMFLCEHNILFFLTVNHQFDLIKKLMTVKKKRMKRRRRYIARRMDFYDSPLLTKKRQSPLDKLLNKGQFDAWMRLLARNRKILSFMLYCELQQLYCLIDFEYRRQHMAIHCDLHEESLLKFVDSLRMDSTLDPLFRSEYGALYTRLIINQERMNMEIRKKYIRVNGEVDSTRQEGSLIMVAHIFSTSIDDIRCVLERCPVEISRQAVVSEILERIRLNRRLSESKVPYAFLLEVMAGGLEAAKGSAIEDTVDYTVYLIKTLQHCSDRHPSKNAKQALDLVVERLKVRRSAIPHTEHPQALKVVYESLAKEIEGVFGLLEPVEVLQPVLMHLKSSYQVLSSRAIYQPQYESTNIEQALQSSFAGTLVAPFIDSGYQKEEKNVLVAEMGALADVQCSSSNLI